MLLYLHCEHYATTAGDQEMGLFVSRGGDISDIRAGACADALLAFGRIDWQLPVRRRSLSLLLYASRGMRFARFLPQVQ